MPISGIVISTRPEKKQLVLTSLKQLAGIEIHGDDDKGNIVAVLDTNSSEAMEKLIDGINGEEHVLHVGVTYLNTEDEAERMKGGERLAKPFGFRKTIDSQR